MITKLFTFGYGHSCPFTSKKLDDHYATITAPSEAECTALMVHLFGTQWAFPYNSPDAAGVDRFGLTEHMRLTVGAPTSPVTDPPPPARDTSPWPDPNARPTY